MSQLKHYMIFRVLSIHNVIPTGNPKPDTLHAWLPCNGQTGWASALWKMGGSAKNVEIRIQALQRELADGELEPG